MIRITTHLTPVLALLAATTLLAGCGKETPNGANLCEPSNNSNQGSLIPGPAVGGPGTGAPASGPAGQLLQGLGQAWSTCNTFSAKYQLKETKGGEVENAKVSFWLKKPSKYRYEVASHTASIKNGSTSVFDIRSRQITSRLGGVASFIPIKGTLDDSRSKSVRGWSLDMTDYASQVEMFLAPGAQVTAGAGGAPILELTRPARYNGSIELMRATLDPQRMLPVSIEMIAGGQVVYKKSFSNLQVNPSIAADKFSL